MGQNYKNHARLVIGYHGVLSFLLVSGLIGSGVNLYEARASNTLYSASLILLLFICCTIMYAYVRMFPLRAQDRAIRAEENLRHFIIRGKPLPAGLTLHQIIALRFASNEEFPELVLRAVNENLKPKEIKLAIRAWKEDHHRV